MHVVVGFVAAAVILGMAIIYRAYLSSGKSESIDDLMARGRRIGFKEWRVEKQVIALRPEESQSKALVTTNPQKGYYQEEMITFDWPRVIRVTITNDDQTHLIGDCGLNQEKRLEGLTYRAQERCNMLNAHAVR